MFQTFKSESVTQLTQMTLDHRFLLVGGAERWLVLLSSEFASSGAIKEDYWAE